MKKKLFLGLLGLPILFLWGCSPISNNNNLINTWYLEKIYQIEQQLTWLAEQLSWLTEQLNLLAEHFSWLQTDYGLLKEHLSWSLSGIQALKSENETLQTNIERYKKMIVDNKVNKENNIIVSTNTNNTSTKNNNPSNNIIVSNSATSTTSSIEDWLITQVYIDSNWNKKMEVDYIQFWWSDQCNWWVTCIINQNPKLRTFTVSDNIEIVVHTFSHTSDGNFRNNQSISFEYLLQKFYDTTEHEHHPFNYSKRFRRVPFRITIENNIITKIIEQYLP